MPNLRKWVPRHPSEANCKASINICAPINVSFEFLPETVGGKCIFFKTIMFYIVETMI